MRAGGKAAGRPPLLAFDDATVSAAAWLSRAFVLFYAFVLPFTHNAAAKNFALIGLLAAAALTAREGRLKLDLRAPVPLALAAVTVLALVSVLLGTDLDNDVDEFRKHFLPMAVLFPLVAIHFRRREAAFALLSVMAAAFAVRAGLALYEMLTIGREDSLFFKGYGMDAALYAPLLMGLAIGGAKRRYLSAAALVLAVAALVVGGARTALAAVVLGCLAIPLVLGRWRPALLFVVAAGLVGGATLVSKPGMVQHFGSVLKSSAYTGPTGLSSRYPIWLGVWEVAQQRPVLGHGFGWKKLGRTAVEQGFVERWKTSGDPYLQQSAWWFSLPTDKVNPHSLIMQVLFETGFVGLAVYAVVLATLFRQALALARGAPPEWRIFAATTVGFLASYVVINIANGLWIGAGPSTMLLAVLEICRRAKAQMAESGGHGHVA
jgi:O-antigen ligase